MICPECGERNAEEGDRCAKCSASLQPDASVAAFPTRRSRTAILSFLLALLGFVWLGVAFWSGLLMFFVWVFFQGGCVGLLLVLVVPIPWIGAILLGMAAKREIRGSSGRITGIWLARTGVILGACEIVLSLLLSVPAYNVSIHETSIGAKVSRVRTDMRSLATAVEAYYVDNNIYPAWAIGAKGPGGTQSYNYRAALPQNAFRPRRDWYYQRKGIGPFYWYKRIRDDSNSPADLPSFALNDPSLPGQAFMTLTTPIAYITSFPADSLSPVRGATFVYWSVFPGDPDLKTAFGDEASSVGGVGWIMVSPGPDRKYDLPGNWDVYDPSVAQPSARLLAGTGKQGFAFTYDPTNGTISHGDIWRVKQ